MIIISIYGLAQSLFFPISSSRRRNSTTRSTTSICASQLHQSSVPRYHQLFDRSFASRLRDGYLSGIIHSLRLGRIGEFLASPDFQIKEIVRVNLFLEQQTNNAHFVQRLNGEVISAWQKHTQGKRVAIPLLFRYPLYY